MAKLFLSYSRRDAVKAQRFTEWLEREGHDVWRDEDDIGGGASFSAEIEKALQDCDAVLVLWSEDSVQSGWVRDEAAYGRDKGKLIPLSLDRTEPPLGFRQYQSIDLSKWRGHRLPPGADKIRAAIERITHEPQAQRSPTPAARRGWKQAILERPWLVGAVITVAIAAAAFFAWQRWSASQQIEIAVLPSPRSSDRAMATDYANAAAADMADVLPRRFDRAAVIAPADAPGGNVPGYRMLVSTEPRGAAVSASLTLSDQDGRATLWSKNWSVPDASAADLKAQVSASASKAAVCLIEARGGSSRLAQPALGLYLSGCADLGDSNRSNEDFTSVFERVTKLAPGFGPAWDYLALGRSWIAEASRDNSSPAYAAQAQNARDAIAVARKLNPNSAMSYDAEYHLNSNDTLRSLQILERGAKIDPDNGEIQMHLSNGYLSVGRMADAVAAAQRGVELDPGTPYTRSQYIQALVYAGEFSKAKADIAEARKKWPGDASIDFAEYGLQYRYGDPKAALALMPRIADYSDQDMMPARKLIAARLDPTPAKIDDAIAALKGRWGNEPHARNIILLGLGTFGRVDEIYQLLEDPKFQPFIDTNALFRPDFAKVRADRRFMQVAARVGLVHYWRQSGYWPDFCKAERLPYDCKTEAAKY